MPQARPLYRERLTPTQFWWLAAVGVGACLGLILFPVAGRPGLVLGAMAGAAIGIAILLGTSAVVEVAEGRLQAGRATLPVAQVGAVEVLGAQRMADLRGPGIDPRAYHCQRAWIAGGVKVSVQDPQDPTPYWLVSSQHPDLLAEAIETARQRSG